MARIPNKEKLYHHKRETIYGDKVKNMLLRFIEVTDEDPTAVLIPEVKKLYDGDHKVELVLHWAQEYSEADYEKVEAEREKLRERREKEAAALKAKVAAREQAQYERLKKKMEKSNG